MKKTIPVIIILIVTAIGAYYFINKNKDQENQENKVLEGEMEVEPKTTPTVVEEVEKIKNEESGEGDRCVFSIRTGDRVFEAEAYISGDKYKTITFSGDSDNEKKFTVFDGENFYTWREGEAKGFQMNLKCAEEIGMEVEESREVQTKEPAERRLEPVEIFENAQSANCDYVEKADLSIPENVDFVDQCRMLKNQMEEIKKLQ